MKTFPLEPDHPESAGSPQAGALENPDERRAGASEERLRRVLEAIPDVVVLYGPDLRIRYINPATTTITGMAPAEFIGRRDDELFPSEQHLPITKLLEKTLTSCRSQSLEIDLELPRTGLRHLSITCLPLLEADGRVREIVGITRDRTEEVLRERQLGENRKLLEIAGKAARLGGWRVDLGTGQVTWSDEVAKIHGEPPGTSPGIEDGIRYYVPEHRERIRQAWHRCVEHGEAYDEELEIIASDGRRKWVRATGEPVRDDNGRVVEVSGAFQDISDRKATEAAVIRSEERYRHAAEASQAALWEYDIESDRITFSDAFRAMLGYSSLEEMPDRMSAYMDLMQPEDRQQMEALQQLLMSGETGDRVTAEFRLRTRDGEFRWFQTNSMVIRDDQGRPVRRLGSTIDIHDRKVAEERTRRMAERLSSTLERMTDGFCILDRDWRFIFLNRQAENLLARDRDELAGCNLWEAFPELVGSAFSREFQRALASGEPVRFEARFEPVDAWFGVTAYPVDEGLAVYFRDTSAQRRAREALEASESRYRKMFKLNPQPMWVYDLESLRFLAVNDATVKHYGFSEQEFLAMTILDIRPDEEAPAVREQVTRSADELYIHSGIWRHRRGDGEPIDVEISSHRLNFEGRPARLVLAQDVTERRRYEARLAEQAELLDKARDAIIVRDMDLNVRFWNKGAERLCGWTREEALGNPIETLLGPEAFRAFNAAHRKVLEAGEWSGLLELPRKDGSMITVDTRWTLMCDDQGTPESVFAISTDVTEKIELERRLSQAQRLESIGQLTGGIAHDFNNLLTVILGNAELLHDQLAEQPKLRHLAEMSRSAARRGSELTQRLLAFARRQPLEPRPTRIDELLDGMEGLLRHSLPENIRVRVEHEPDLWPAEVDPAQLESAVLNLVLNARDALPEGGNLIISTANLKLEPDQAAALPDLGPGEYVELSVSDDGEGIPADHLERLFEPFFTTKEPGKGTGLGLAMVYGFVKQSRGHVLVDSEPGGGSRFRLYLPRSHGPVSAAESWHGEEELAGDGERILVVEDDELVREHAERILHQLGYETRVAVDGNDALERLEREGPFDLLFTDVVMPGGMNGLELADKAAKRVPGLRVLFTSGYSENALAPEGGLGSGSMLLQKPYRRIELARKIRAALQAETNWAKTNWQ